MWQEPKTMSDKFASKAEARKAIESLTDADYAKLMLIARSFARARIRGTVIQPGDLLHDAIVKTVDGPRHWNKSVSIIRHLDRVMESDAGHVAEKGILRGTAQNTEGTDVSDTKGTDLETQTATAEEFTQFMELFSGDDRASDILNLKRDDLSASEIQRELGITKTEYETALKRIRRRVVIYLAERGPQP